MIENGVISADCGCWEPPVGGPLGQKSHFQANMGQNGKKLRGGGGGGGGLPQGFGPKEPRTRGKG